MKVGIIGAGMIGGTLTRRLSALGHAVSVANSRGGRSLAELAEETGAVARTVENVAEGAELVIVSVPQKSVPLLPHDLFASRAPGAPIVDTGNYYPDRDGRIEAIEGGMIECRWVERQIGWPVIKAFNTIYFAHLLDLGRPKGLEGRIALPVSGDDPVTKRLVMEVVEALGFDAVDAGGLDESWREEPGTPCYGADLDAERLRRALAEAVRLRPPKGAGR